MCGQARKPLENVRSGRSRQPVQIAEWYHRETMRLAPRVVRQTESATMAVARRAAELRAQGVTLIDLGPGELAVDSPTVAVDAARSALASGDTRYTAVDGPLVLRQAIAARFAPLGAPWTGTGDTIVTVGAKGALFAAMQALVGRGDRVVIPTPRWSTLAAQVELAGGEVIDAPTADAGFALRAQDLLRRIDSRTVAVVLNSPCNPTGAVMPSDELGDLVAGCAQRDIALISDETYRDFYYPDPDEARRAAPSVAEFAAQHPGTVCLVSSVSKAYAMTGWRIGYALGPPVLVSAMRLVQGHLTSNATSFAMVGAIAALREAEADVERNVKDCARNRGLVIEALRDAPMTLIPPKGAFYAWVHVETPESTTDLARRLLEESRVVVVPGEAFGAPGYLRISLAASSEDLMVGLGRLRQALSGRSTNPAFASG